MQHQTDLQARWRELVARYNSDFEDDESGDAHDALVAAFCARVWATPPRTLADLAFRAEIAQFLNWPEHDDFGAEFQDHLAGRTSAPERALAELIAGVLALNFTQEAA